MTEREETELAALAADWAWDTYDEKHGLIAHLNPDEACAWNPLTDNADAFRLMVSLGLVVEVGYAHRGFIAVRSNTDNWQEYREAYGNDVYAATRRAIFRAAVEIGKKIKQGAIE